MTQLIVNEKQLVTQIKKAEIRFEKSLKSFVDDCILFGEELAKIKNIVGHGGWENFLNRNSEFRFATTRQASKFIRIAENKTLARTFLMDETSINGLTKGISEATPEQIEKAKLIESELEAKHQKAEAEKKRKEEEKKAKQTNVIEGDFKEVKAEVKKTVEQEPSPVELLHDTINDLQDANTELQTEIESMARVFDANDQVTQALSEVKRYQEQNRILKERVNGLLGELSEAKRTAKYWKKEYEKVAKGVVNG